MSDHARDVPITCRAYIVDVISPLDVILYLDPALDADRRSLRCRLYGAALRGAIKDSSVVMDKLRHLLTELSFNHHSPTDAAGSELLVKVRRRRDEIPIEGPEWSVEIIGTNANNERVSLNELLISLGYLSTWLESW